LDIAHVNLVKCCFLLRVHRNLIAPTFKEL